MAPINPPALFISPHIDDVVFSCGGTLSQLAGQGDVQVIDIFSDYGKATEVRKEEEKQAARVLGFDCRFLDFPDLFQRDGTAFLLHRMFRPMDPDKDAKLLDGIFLRVQEAISDFPHCRIYFPLGVGFHIDHETCFQLGKRFAKTHEVLFYEDIPYALIPGLLRERLTYIMGGKFDVKNHHEIIDLSSNGLSASQYLASRPPYRRFPARLVRPLLGLYFSRFFRKRNSRILGHRTPPLGLHLTPQYVCIDGYLEKKIEAMWLYQSQVGEFFYSKEEAVAALSRFYRNTRPSDGKLFERFWKIA